MRRLHVACTLLLFLLAQGATASVLVLGSGGLIGSAVTRWLRARNYEVLEVVNRTHIDLREPGALDQFRGRGVQFCFFLACEVGGAKFIERGPRNVQLDIMRYNLKIYQTVFQWLEQEQVPYLFTSSYLQTQPNAYGTVKRLGEAWISSLGRGKVVRLWNIYGHERVGLKSHVLSDWVSGCLTRKRIDALTDGTEARQFLHADDCAAALGVLMENYDSIEPVTDISSNQWTTLQELAALVDHQSPWACPATFNTVSATARALIAPDTTARLYSLWTPAIPLHTGVERLFREFAASLNVDAEANTAAVAATARLVVDDAAAPSSSSSPSSPAVPLRREL